MTPEKRKKAKEILSEIQSLPRERRSEFLGDACAGDKDLKTEITRLLEQREETAQEPEQSVFQAGNSLNGRYEIIRRLGSGGMGEVFLARDAKMNRRVSLKVLRSDVASNRERLRRFHQEAQAVSALNHPHIVTVYEVDQTADRIHFIVGEFIDGETLNDYCRREQPRLGEVLEIALQIASALSAAHAVGIVHRDIKPENIMIRRDGYVKVLDFGLAKLTNRRGDVSGSEDATRELKTTNPGTIMGTAAYMSPEQSRGVEIDHRTDLWSLGVVAYEMLTGRQPFSGETPADVLAAVIYREPAPLGSFLDDVPAELEWIVAKTLSKKAEGRYQTAEELRADLDKIRKRLEFDRQPQRPSKTPGEIRSENPTEEIKGASTFGDRASPTDRGAREAHGQVSAADSAATETLSKSKLPKAFTIVAGSAVAVLAAVAFYYFFAAAPKSERIDSIAVLPFANLNQDKDLAYLSDGISENLMNRLSALPQLKVISKNSSFKFRDSAEDLPTIASRLGVRALVTGSTMQIGDDLVIKFEIVDAAQNRHLLGGQYQRKAKDLLKIQNEIPQAIADQLNLKLTDAQSQRIAAGGTENAEAFRYYLNGLVELNGPENVLGKSLEYFQKAVELDPNFADARAEIAWIYWNRANASENPRQLVPKVKEETEKALAIDPNLAKAQVMLAALKEFDFDWQGAEREYQRAIDLNPNLDFARQNYAFFLSVTGRHEQALAELEQLKERDPINLRQILTTRGIVLAWAKRFDEALQEFQKAQAIDPNIKVEDFSLGYAYGGKGLDKEAAARFKNAVEVVGGDEKYSLPLVFLAASYAKIPEKQTEARAILSRLETMKGYVSPATVAIVCVALKDNDKAMRLLEKAYLEKDLQLRFVGVGYEYDGLRQDARFADLIKRIGLQ